jgi:myo-inositol 2-dehydrogenase/D-chiro-inositol 1-dehydrogenase
MLPADINPKSEGPSRRKFIQGASALVAGGIVLGTNARIARSAWAGGDDEIKIGVIGCGGRGRDATLQALQTKGKVCLWAMADAFPDRLEQSLSYITDTVKEGEGEELLEGSRVDVPKDRQFVGFDAYQKVIDSGVDLVILATSPGFRPLHFEAAVKAGKHIFCEKPVAVDAPGIRRFLAANEEAKKKNLMVAVGLQRRHHPGYLETLEQINDGALGDILATRVYWNGGGLWVKPRTPQQTEMEYQMRNWYYFVWLCGDHIVEQHIHNIDISNWFVGAKHGDAAYHPTEALGMGGRQVRTGKDHGQIFDHFAVEFTYPDGTKMFSQCRHWDRCPSDVSEHFIGTKALLDIDDKSGGRIKALGRDSDPWRSKPFRQNNWHQEHHDLFAALRRGEIYNEGDYGANSTMSAILGRMATYSGQTVKWDDAIASKNDMSPKSYAFDADPPVKPDADGNYPIPMPGRTDPMEG